MADRVILEILGVSPCSSGVVQTRQLSFRARHTLAEVHFVPNLETEGSKGKKRFGEPEFSGIGIQVF